MMIHEADRTAYSMQYEAEAGRDHTYRSATRNHISDIRHTHSVGLGTVRGSLVIL